MDWFLFDYIKLYRIRLHCQRCCAAYVTQGGKGGGGRNKESQLYFEHYGSRLQIYGLITNHEHFLAS